MKLLYPFLFLLLTVGCGVSCQGYEQDKAGIDPAERVYVTFALDNGDDHTTRAVPNAPNGTETTADPESAYKTVDIVFFNADGSKAYVNAQGYFHFDASGFKPSNSEKEKWVSGTYERDLGSGNYLRGVYLDGVNRNAVQGKTCVVMLNLPNDVKTRLGKGASQEITSLTALQRAVVRQLNSADEQLGPKPYPMNGSNIDYNSAQFKYIVMVGEKKNIDVNGALKPVITVDVKRTIAKVKLYVMVGGNSTYRAALNTSHHLLLSLHDFPKKTVLGSVWKAETSGARAKLDGVVSGGEKALAVAIVPNSEGSDISGLPYVTKEFYMNEYGVLPDAPDNNPYPYVKVRLKATLFSILPVDQYWKIALPRGIERNKSYKIYVTIRDNGNPTNGGTSVYTLKVDKVTIAPWTDGADRFFHDDNFGMNNFEGDPKNPNDRI